MVSLLNSFMKLDGRTVEGKSWRHAALALLYFVQIKLDIGYDVVSPKTDVYYYLSYIADKLVFLKTYYLMKLKRKRRMVV